MAKALRISVILFAIFAVSAVSVSAQAAKSIAARTVNIEAKPGATVWIDGVNFGTTDETGKLSVRLPATGTRSLRIIAEGFKLVSKPLGPAETSVKVNMAETSDPAELAYQAGLQLALVNRDAAIEKFKEAIAAKPGYIDAHIGLVRTLSDARMLEEADAAIQALKKLKPGIAEVSAIEGRVLKSFGEEEGAIAAFTRSIKEGGGYQPEAHTGLGILYQERAETYAGQSDLIMEEASYDEAARHFAIAAKQLLTAPDAPVVYQLLGLIYEKQRRFDEAIEVYEDFLVLFPDVPEASAVRSFIVQIRKQKERER